MAQEYQQPQRQRSRDEQPDDSDYEAPTSVNDQSADVSQGAQDALDNIDDVLRDYENEASGQTSAQQGIGSSGDLRDAEKDAAKLGQDTSGTAGAAEAAKEGAAISDKLGNGFTPENIPTSKVAAVKMLLSTNKRKAAFGGTVGGIITLLVIIFGISAGPAQLVQLSKVLQKPLAASNDSTESRTNGLFRYARSGRFGETRVGKIGSVTFGKTIKQLEDIGIKFNTDALDRTKSVVIDTAKLSKTFPELEGMPKSEQPAFLADKLNIPEGDIKQISGSGKNIKWGVNTRNWGVEATRALYKGSVEALGNGELLTGIKFRTMARFLGEPSLFHPIKRWSAAKEKSILAAADAKKARQAEEEKRAKATQKAALDEAKIPAEGIKKGLKSPAKAAGAALLAVGGLCLVRSIADDVVKLNYAGIVLPSTIQAVDKVAVGSQIQNGSDLSAAQVGSIADSLTDKNGKTVWQGRALQALANNPKLSGEELPYEYQQAFSNETSAQRIKDTIGGGTAGSIACSPVGIAVQVVAGLAAVVVAVAGAAETGGASVAALAAGKAAIGMVATAGAIYGIEKFATNIFADKAVVAEVASGPIGGNILAYGARSMEGIDARSAGGVELSPKDEAAINQRIENNEKRTFQAKSLFAKVFDINDYRSITGRLAQSVTPSFSQNVASIVGSLTKIGNLLPSTLGALIPKANAETAADYKWPFPMYGIPSDVLNDSRFQNPYDNADKVAALLDNPVTHDKYVPRAKACFGVNISKGSDGWDVSFDTDVNPNEQSYVDAKCGNTSDVNWKRMMLFVFDTKTMKAAACYEGDGVSCQDISAEGGGTSSSTTTSTASATIDKGSLFKDSTSVDCAEGTKDIGIEDGYTGGKKVPIRLCAIPGFSSTGKESNGGYGISGAGGDVVVNSRVSGAVLAMYTAAKSDGVNLAALSSFRTMSHQQDLCPCDGVHVARPGYSNHQMGLAIDFQSLPSSPGPIPGNKVWTWLSKNASKFGYENYPAEAWHWSPTGS